MFGSKLIHVCINFLIFEFVCILITDLNYEKTDDIIERYYVNFNMSLNIVSHIWNLYSVCKPIKRHKDFPYLDFHQVLYDRIKTDCSKNKKVKELHYKFTFEEVLVLLKGPQ